MTGDRVPVLYVTGWCRSGSTLLGNLLNEVPGVIHVGELHYLWRNGILGQGTNSSCGCGDDVRDCVMWRKVIERTGGDVAVAAAVLDDQRRLLRTRHTPARLAESTGRRAASAEVISIVDRMVALYRAIRDETSMRLVVDSGKFPAEAAALAGRDDVDLRVLHLVRDPRATAWSWLRPKAYIPAMGAVRSTGYWTAFNAASDRIGRAVGPERYRRLRYEDMTAAPRDTLVGLLTWCGIDAEPPVATDGSATLGVNHTVTGNPDRLVRGPVTIRPDGSWRAHMPRRQVVNATLVAAPLLRRYGYPVQH